MNIVMLEPIGISEEKINQLALALTNSGHKLEYYESRPEEKEELVSRARDADILIISNLPLEREVLVELDSLKMISAAFTGVDHIDMEYCRENDITVCNSSGYANQAVAELVIGFMVAINRDMVKGNRAVRNGKTGENLIGQELKGNKLGIIGTGAIGTNVAKLARAFGCKLLAYSRSRSKEALELGVEYVSFETLLKESDMITIHLPLVEETENLIGENEFAMMKNSCIVINAARGPIIDSQALASALKNGEVAGAGVDVFEMEPPIPEDHPLLQAPNLLATPHVGFATREAFQKRAEIVFANIEHWLAGDPQNVMN